MNGDDLNAPITDSIRVAVTNACSQQQQQQQQHISSNSNNGAVQSAPKLKFLLPSSLATKSVTEIRNNTPQYLLQLNIPSQQQLSIDISAATVADKTNPTPQSCITTSTRKNLKPTSKQQNQQQTAQPKKLCTSKKRDYHNALERQRRHLITTSFNQLKNSLPASTLESVQQEKASRCLIINKACDHIRTIQAGNLKSRQEIAFLAEQNALLEGLILQLETALLQKSSG